MPDPIYSTLSDDPDARELIEAFVVQLAERVDELQDAEFKGDLDGLAKLADALATRAKEIGFESLSTCASTIVGCCPAGDGDEIREVLLDLTEVATCVRLGHRGSV